MKRLLGLIPFTVFALASCGSSEPAATSSTEGNAPTGFEGPTRTCRPTCTAPSDCAIPGEPLQDAAHYACTAGRCEWQGCASTAECVAAVNTTKVACLKPDGAPMATCVPTCTAAADCAVPGSSLSDEGHFACKAGLCEWQGCKATSECATALHSSKYTCTKPEGADVATCLPTCTAAADCAVPGSGSLNDASHFACISGRCEWRGCRSTSECASNLHSDRYVCE